MACVIESDRLRAMPLFSVLPEQARDEIAEYVHDLDVPAGEPLVSQGDRPFEFFVIEHGQAEVIVDGERTADLGPGDFFGEVALLATGQRSASVAAVSPMKLVVIREQDFRRIERTHPQVAEALQAAIRDRYKVPSP